MSLNLSSVSIFPSEHGLLPLNGIRDFLRPICTAPDEAAGAEVGALYPPENRNMFLNGCDVKVLVIYFKVWNMFLVRLNRCYMFQLVT